MSADVLGPPPVWHLKSNAEYGAPGITAWSHRAWKEMVELRAENQRLRDALGFYAEPLSYENETPRHVRAVIADNGEIARRALAGDTE